MNGANLYQLQGNNSHNTLNSLSLSLSLSLSAKIDNNLPTNLFGAMLQI